MIFLSAAGIGRFTFNFAMYTSQSYASQHYSYPAKVKLRDWLYFQAKASVQDNNLVLLIDQCYSTPNMDRNHNNKYFFINYGYGINILPCTVISARATRRYRDVLLMISLYRKNSFAKFAQATPKYIFQNRDCTPERYLNR